MRYHYEKPEIYSSMFGHTYEVSGSPIFDTYTLYRINDLGLGVIQQRYNPKNKSTSWTSIDPWLVDDIYKQDGFKAYFDERSGIATNGIYPTVTVRQIMWALKMKPIKREPWETVFDRRYA